MSGRAVDFRGLRTSGRLGLAGALLACALFPAAAAAQGRSCPTIGTKAPPFSILMSDGREGVSLRKALDKKVPVVLGFWAWHCKPCQTELPELQAIADRLGNRIAVILVHVGPDEAKMKANLDQLRVRLPSASDDTEKKRERYCADSLPRTYILDKEGVIRFVFEEKNDGFTDTLLEELRKLGVEG